MTQPAQQLEQQPTQLLVVRRGRDSTFCLLERHFGSDPSVRIIWDRRRQERRRSSETIGTERRRTDRRTQAPMVWPPTNYVVVNIR